MDGRDDRHQIPPPPPITSSGATSWSCFWELQSQESEETEKELKQALLRTTFELESTRLMAQEELRKMEAHSLHLAHLLEIANRERDDARQQCHSLLLLLLTDPHQLPPPTNPTPTPNPSPNPVDESSNVVMPASSSSESDETSHLSSTPPPAAMAEIEAAARKKELPEQGRLVEAVMRAGPLLQTLLLAGPLPEWRHPPPALHSLEIPPVCIGLNPKKKVEKIKGKIESEEGEVLIASPTPSPSPPLPTISNSSPGRSNGSGKLRRTGPFCV